MNVDTITRLRADPVAFRDALQLDDGKPWVRDPWQEEFFLACDPGWQRAIGRDVAGGFSRAWAVRPRGHSKTHDIGAMIAWALFAAERPIRGVVAAGDSDQARLVADAVTRIIASNTWLAPYIEVQRGKIVNRLTGSECAILSSDAPTSFGLLVDFIICDELTMWPKRDLFDSLFSAALKRRHCHFVALGNAGWLDTFQHELWVKLQADPSWFCHSLDGVKASWFSPEAVAEQVRVLPPVVKARLIDNIWTLNESGAIPPDQLDRAIDPDAGPMHGRTDLTAFVAGVDLAQKRDRAALVVLNFSGNGMVRLARAISWHPSQFHDRQIPQSVVEEAVQQAHRDFYLEAAVFDPAAGGFAMMQRCEANGLKCIPYMFTVQNCDVMARCLLAAFAESRIRLYPHAELIADIGKLTLAELPTGWRLRAPRSASGHADLAVSLSISLPHAMAWSNELYQMGNYQERLPPYVRTRFEGKGKPIFNPHIRPSLEEMIAGGARVERSGPGAAVLRSHFQQE